MGDASAPDEAARRLVVRPRLAAVADLNIPTPPSSRVPGTCTRGKVRDLYRAPAGRRSLLMVASDRISAYDFVLDTTIPDKGEILTRMSLWWFEQLADLVPNHVVSTDVPEAVRGRAVVCERLDDVPGRVRRPRLPHRLRACASTPRPARSAASPLPAGLGRRQPAPEPIFTPGHQGGAGRPRRERLLRRGRRRGRRGGRGASCAT